MKNSSEQEQSCLTDSRVTIIGGAGFLAAELISQLLKCGCRVTVADIHPAIASNKLPASLSMHKGPLKSGQLSVIFVDITDPDTFKNIPIGTQKIIHMAAHFSFWPIDTKSAWSVNVEGTKNILEYSLNNAHHCDTVLYYSSIEAVGSGKNRKSLPGAKEYERPDPSELEGCLYKKTKTLAHFAVEEYVSRFKAKNKKIIIHAPCTPFGPGMEHVSTGNLMTKHKGLIRWISPKTVLSCADTRDIARDDILLLKKRDLMESGKTYVTVGFHASIPEILRAKERYTGIPAPKILLPNFSLTSLARFMEAYGNIKKSYQPEITIEQAKRTSQNHYYDVSFTRDSLGLKQENYFGLEETVENVSKYLIEKNIIPDLLHKRDPLLAVGNAQ